MGPRIFLLALHLLLSCLALSCHGGEGRDPPYPLLADSPSLPTPFEDREDGYAARRGRWGFLSRLLGLVIAKPYSRRGLALSFFVLVLRADLALSCVFWFGCCFWWVWFCCLVSFMD